MRVVRTRRGARIVHGKSILSEILARPGPTHSIFDLLGAIAAMRGPSARVAVLGFAAGGMIAPLRALGSDAAVRAVDLDLTMVPLFEELCGEWAGDLKITRADAVAWLGRQRRLFDVIIEDLSVPMEQDVGKPEVSFTALPAVIHEHLAPSGIAVVNVLPMARWPWPEVRQTLVRPWQGAGMRISFEDYVNRFVVVGRDLGTPTELSRELRASLRAIGSEIAERFSVQRI